MTPEEEILKLAEQIKALLAGKGPAVQSAVLAELTSIWLAGIWVPESKEETRRARDELLEHYVEMVRELTLVNARIMGTSAE